LRNKSDHIYFKLDAAEVIKHIILLVEPY